MSGPATSAEAAGFAGSRDRFESLVGFLAGDQAGSLTHHELESRLQPDGRELLRGLFQDHLDLRAGREARIDTVADAKPAIPTAAPFTPPNRGLKLAVGRER